MTTNGFAGFSQGAVLFLQNLKANNTRAWFNANKQIYESEIKKPAEDFVSTIAGGLHDLTGKAHGSKVFRIHRDVRFSKDKTPYNAHLHIGFTPKGGLQASPSWFFGLDTEKLTLGTGVFAFEKPTLERYRERVAGPEGATLAAILSRSENDGCRLSEPDLARVPPGYAKDHPQAALLKRKGLAVWIDLGGPEQATRDDLAEHCLTAFARMKPVFDWLNG